MNHYYKIFCGACLLLSSVAHAQNVGIGTNSPDPAAKLEINSTSGGVLIPRLTTVQKNAIPSPPAGLMVFDNTANQFSFYDGTKWTSIKPIVSNDSIWDSYVINNERNVFNAMGQHFYLGGGQIQSIGSLGNIDGVLRLEHGSGGMLTTSYWLSMDGNSIQSRTKSGTIFNPPVDANLSINAFGGNVGMGTSTPTKAKLQVNGFVGNTVGLFARSANSQGLSFVADWPGLYFNCYFNGGVKTMASSGYAGLLNFDQNSGGFVFNANTAPNVGIDQFISLSEVMRITKDGKVGIGTSNPTYPLSVNGQIQAKEVRVETGWSDYVFDKTFKLPSLSQVEKYIQDNKHLPGIPSAAEISRDGLALADVNTKMMAKIEELTLYVIQLEKKVKQQDQRISKLAVANNRK